MPTTAAQDVAAKLDATDRFADRHIGPDAAEIREMLDILGADSLEQLVDDAIPDDIQLNRALNLPIARTETEALADLRAIADKNVVRRSFIGMGYAACDTPAVILRNLFENPGWYTQYTPYQAEISQGRLEALLNFQQMISDLTGLPLANASLLDEATAAAEAMAMAKSIAGAKKNTFLVDAGCHPQTIGVVTTRARSLGIDVVIADCTLQIAEDGTIDGRSPGKDSALQSAICNLQSCFGVLLQYPTTTGTINDYAELADRVHDFGGIVVAAADILSLCVLTPPGEWGADICVGNSQRFGVPIGFGGPHAAFMATLEKHARKMPGRLVGVSRDAHGDVAYRLTLQTREQHIRRDKATSNICTAQVLLAIMASMFAVYHGPEGLRRIAERVRLLTAALAAGLQRMGHDVTPGARFDTVHVKPVGLDVSQITSAGDALGYNFRDMGDGSLCISLDQRSDRNEVQRLIECFAGGSTMRLNVDELAAENAEDAYPHRTTGYLTHPVFNTHHSEHELLRYLQRLQNKDLSLTHSMIALGSCTMKLNAAAEMLPVSWPAFSELHPFAPADQTRGYAELFEQLEQWLGEITGFAGVSLQPNAGSQGEYAGLLAIRRYHESRGEGHRDVCLIPDSAHGTNPASAVIAGYRVVVVGCRDNGDIDLDDLTAKCKQHVDKLAALMVTYPSTHGVFEKHIRAVCNVVHDNGGQVYMDGANMNAQVGLCRPGDFGADVCHLNLHKTFCIPHGGGGPGMGPIGVAEHLVPFLPGDPRDVDSAAVSAAPFGSASILPISWMYIAMMGPAGLARATETAILNANYMAKRLSGHFDVLYTGTSGRVAHEFIIDCRPFKHVSVEDIAKRLMDYGFHAPTMSWPVAGTLMIEPTESETKGELDRFCDALISIRREIDEKPDVLKNAPHTVGVLSGDEWPFAYSRSDAGFPLPWVRGYKFWPSIGRIDNVFGDRNVVCTCPPISEYASS